MKKVIRSLSVISYLLVLVGPGCKEIINSPFFDEPGTSGPEITQADLQVGPLSGDTVSDDGSCSLVVDRQEKIIALEVQVGPVTQRQAQERYARIELEVSVGLTNDGRVLADTSGVPVSGAGAFSLLLPIEYPKALSEGKNEVAIVAITRYLDGAGKLALPLGRQLRYCSLTW